MKTASFWSYQGPGRISIARFAPSRVPAGYQVFRALAPGPWFKSVSRDEYIVRYRNEILANHEPRQLWETLHALAAPHEPVLLCWERPPLTEKNWCHRRMVADYFHTTLGIDVPEVEWAGASTSPASLTLPFDIESQAPRHPSRK